jgi:5-oxoprolinase (ATP-hydrolysing) subunit A
VGSTWSMDLNADLGERFDSWRQGDDEALLSVVTTAHIACGFHSGDATTMLETVSAAVRFGVAVGAHPSYLDRAGFGRRPMDVDPRQVRADVLYQIGALDGIARAAGGRVRSVKAHGALYNRMATDVPCALAVAEATRDFDDSMWLVVPAGSPAVEVARSAGLRVAEEAFCDRRYTGAGALVPRGETGALITDPAEAARRAVRLGGDHEVDTTDGAPLHLWPTTLCVHGDTPGAAAVAGTVRLALEQAGMAVRAFSSE